MVPDGWRERPLQELASVDRGKFSARPRNDPQFYGGNIPFVQTGDIAAARTYLRSYTQTLNQQGLAVSKLFPEGTILVTIAANIGDIAIATFDVACPDSVVAIQAKPSVTNPLWLLMALETQKRRLDNQATQNAQKNINLQVLRPLRILTPPLEEQNRIAEILSTWDEAMTAVKHLIDKSERQRNALIQRLIWGNERLPSFVSSSTRRRTKYGSIPKDWEFPPLHEIAYELSKRNVGGKDFPVLVCSKHVGFVDSLQYFKKKVFSDDTTNYKLVPRGAFGFPANHIEEGSIGYQDICEMGLVSPIYCVFGTNDKVCNGYLYRLLKTDHYRQIFAAATNSSVDRRGSLRWKEFSKIHVPLPSLEEQQAISHIIDIADDEIRCLEQQLEALRNEKTALMQRLLTGKLRVRADETVESAYA